MDSERKEKEDVLNQLWDYAGKDWIELYFGDESGFSMVPKIPQGWAPKGERVEIVPQRGKKVNVFGIFRADNFCVTYENEKNMDSDFIIKAIDDFCQYIDKEKPAVLVIDNAPTHTAEKFLAKVEEWMEKNLYIFYLPRYSPHLNIAERFWQKAKYEWIRPQDYLSFGRFKKKIREIFNQMGTTYKIEFSQTMV